jgi:hypothetical protein
MYNQGGYANIILGAMDTHWQQSKVCDIRKTLLGLWMLIGNGATPWEHS